MRDDINKAVLNALSECRSIDGRQVGELEKSLAEYVGVKHCVSCANGTDAIFLMLAAWGVGKGDAVFVPDFTFFATAEAVARTGAVPIFTDVQRDTFNMDVQSLDSAVQRVKNSGRLNAKAIVAVDMFGLPANYPELSAVAEKYGLLLFQDSAQGFGGEINGRRSGSFGDAGAVSFFPSKPLGCYGDGGAVFTNDTEKVEVIRSLKCHGKGENKYENVRIGINSRLDTVQAAILQVKFDAFKNRELAALQFAAELYNKHLHEKWNSPVVPKGFKSAWAQYTIRFADEYQRDAVQKKLEETGIPTMIYYPKPLSRQQAFKNLEKFEDCPNAEELCKTVLSLPIHPYITIEEICKTAAVINKF